MTEAETNKNISSYEDGTFQTPPRQIGKNAAFGKSDPVNPWSQRLSTALKLELHTKIFEESVYKALYLLSNSMQYPLTKSKRLETQSHFGSKWWGGLFFDGVNHEAKIVTLVCRSPPYSCTVCLIKRQSGHAECGHIGEDVR